MSKCQKFYLPRIVRIPRSSVRCVSDSLWHNPRRRIGSIRGWRARKSVKHWRALRTIAWVGRFEALSQRWPAFCMAWKYSNKSLAQKLLKSPCEVCKKKKPTQRDHSRAKQTVVNAGAEVCRFWSRSLWLTGSWIKSVWPNFCLGVVGLHSIFVWNWMMMRTRWGAYP
jgi:hypothetical protein